MLIAFALLAVSFLFVAALVFVAQLLPESQGWTQLIVGVVVLALLFYAVALAMGVLLAPVWEILGLRRYYSDFLLASRVRLRRSKGATVYALHLGTEIDFLLHGYLQGTCTPTRILADVVEGLLEIESLVERGEIPESTRFEASSHFLPERLAERLHFKVERASKPTIVLMLVGYPLIRWRGYLVGNHVSLRAVLFRARTVRFAGDDLVRAREKLRRILRFYRQQ